MAGVAQNSSDHIPLSRTQSCGHASLQRRLRDSALFCMTTGPVQIGSSISHMCERGEQVLGNNLTGLYFLFVSVFPYVP